MNRNLHDNTLRDAAIRWAADIHAPALDLPAIRRRAFRQQYPPELNRSGKLRVAIAACVVVAMLLAAEPSVSAIVKNASGAFFAFVVGNGHVHTARTRTVTLEQARKDVPFSVLTPIGIPPSFHAKITEVYPSQHAVDAQIWFEFSSAEPLKSFAILETATTSRYAPRPNDFGPVHAQFGHGNGEMVLTRTQAGRQAGARAITLGGAPETCVSIKFSHSGPPDVRTACQPPPAAARGHVFLTTGGKRGPAPRLPIRWVAHGTLVVLLDPSGVLSRQQVDALRAAMSR